MGRYQKGKTSLDFTEARERVIMPSARLYASLHLAPDTPLLSFLQAGRPSCRPTNSIKALKAFETSNSDRICSTNYYKSTARKSDLLPQLSRLVLPFWYRLTQAVLEKRLLNRHSSSSTGCNSSNSSITSSFQFPFNQY